MKKPGGEVALLTPDAQGWRLVHGGKAQSSPTLDGALALLPARVPLHFALPAPMALLERLTLPSTDREELSGMVQLQLEKTLPYPVDEVTSDFEILHAEETESTVLSTSVHIPGLETLCEPMKTRQRLPEKISIFAQHVAAACPADETVLAVWQEQDQLAIAICENARLSWVDTLTGTDADTLRDDLSRALLSAEMEGVPANFSRVLLGSESPELESALRESFEVPVETLMLDRALPEPPTNLVPSSWVSEVRRFENREHLRQRLTWAAMAYLVLIAFAFLYLAWMKRQVQQVDAKVAEMQPQVEAVARMQARWRVLRPAIDKELYTVEVLRVVQEQVRVLHEKVKSANLTITLFEYSQAGDGTWSFTVAGEAPEAKLVIAFAEELQKAPELKPWKVVKRPEDTFLPDGRVQFRIVGKLQ